jgi:hypothetical protein
MRVEGHPHFWQWTWFCRPESGLSRNHLPDGLEKYSAGSETSTFVGGVVGWLDLKAPAFSRKLKTWQSSAP